MDELMTREVADFKIFSGLLKTFTADDGRKHIKGIASSSVKDLHGDIMELSALQSMERTAKQNMTIWLNHEYEVPKDIFGSCVGASLVARNDVWDMDVDIVVNETNPRAIDTYNAIDSGVKLGLSIGALLKDYTLEKDGTFVIRDVELLEASVVSIPANPRSWVQYAAKSARAKERERTAETALASATGTAALTGPATTSNSATTITQTSTTPAAPEPADADDEEQKAAKCPDCGAYGDCEHRSKDAPPPDVQAQEAPGEGSDPENADDPEVQASADADDDAAAAADGDNEDTPQTEFDQLDPSVVAQIGDLTTKSITELVELLRSTTTELVTVKAELLTANHERDLAVQGFFAATEVVEKVADLPLSRKARGEYGTASASLSRLNSIYSERFMQMLQEKTNG